MSRSARCRSSRKTSRGCSSGRASRSGSPSTGTRRSPRMLSACRMRSRPRTCARRSRLLRSYPFVTMFVWFVYQDDPGQPWESGLYTRTGVNKGSAPSRFSSSARPLDAPDVLLGCSRQGTASPAVMLYTRRFCVVDAVGETIGVTWRVTIPPVGLSTSASVPHRYKRTARSASASAGSGSPRRGRIWPRSSSTTSTARV